MSIKSDFILYNKKIVEILEKDDAYFGGDAAVDKECYIDVCKDEMNMATSGEWEPEFEDLAITYASYEQVLKENKDLI